MVTALVTACWLVFTLSPGPAARLAASGEVESRRAALRAEFVADLVELADWCHQERAYGERDTLYGKVLVFDGDHAEARKALKYRRDKYGEWKQSSTYRTPANRSADDVLGLLEVKLSEATSPFSSALLALLEGATRKELDLHRSAVIGDILTADPHDPGVHAYLGEVRIEDVWVLSETARAKDRRAELKSIIRRGLTEVQRARRAEPTEMEKGLGIEWAEVLETDGVRVLGTVDRAEVSRTAQVCEALGAAFRNLFAVDTDLYPGFTIYILTGEARKRAFLLNHPAVTDSKRDALMTLVGTGIPGTANVAQWHPDPAQRLDGTVRHTLGGLFRDSFNVSTHHGWIFEGFGIYLTWRVIGTRLTWYVNPKVGSPLQPRLLVSGSNWMNESYSLLKSEKRPNFARVMAHDIGEMTIADLLASYALAAYFLEGRPEETPAILRRIGAGEPAHSVIEEELGIPFDDFDERVVRWLSERR